MFIFITLSNFYQQLKWFLKGVVIESIAVTIVFFKTLLVHLIFEIRRVCYIITEFMEFT